jgi:hypothetical protein
MPALMRRIITLLLLASSLPLTGCGEQKPAVTVPPTAAAFDTGIDTKHLMSWIVDPSSKVVFGAVASIITDKGEEQIQPRTDEEWNVVRNNAAIVLESGNLLLLEGRAKSSQIQDAADWNAKSRAMSAAARTAIEATEVKDPEALFTASGDIYQACTDCHAKYIFTAQPATQQ